METLETCFQPLLNFGSHIWLPANFGSQISLAGPEAQPAKWLGLSHMAAIQPNVCISAKWLVISQMATTQPNGYSSAIWMGLSQVAGTQSNGCDSAKKLRISKKELLNRGKHNMAMYYLFIERQRTLLYYDLYLFLKNHLRQNVAKKFA